jgi:hypothetical protein
LRIFIKEENPLLVRGLGFLLRKNKEENPLLLQRQSHFAPQNKEENPLLLQEAHAMQA